MNPAEPIGVHVSEERLAALAEALAGLPRIDPDDVATFHRRVEAAYEVLMGSHPPPTSRVGEVLALAQRYLCLHHRLTAGQVGRMAPAEVFGRMIDDARAVLDGRLGRRQEHGLVLDEVRMTASLAGTTHPLTADQTRVLAAIVAGRGQWVDREELGRRCKVARPDKIVRAMPDAVRSLVEAKRGAGGGYRVRPEHVARGAIGAH